MKQSEAAASIDVAAPASTRTGLAEWLVLGGVTPFGLGQGLLIPPIIGVVLSRVPVAGSLALSRLLAPRSDRGA